MNKPDRHGKVPSWTEMSAWLIESLNDQDTGFIIELGPNPDSGIDAPTPAFVQIHKLADATYLLRRSRVDLDRLTLLDHSAAGQPLDEWTYDDHFHDCTDGYLFSRDLKLLAGVCVAWFRDKSGNDSTGEIGFSAYFPAELPAIREAPGPAFDDLDIPREPLEQHLNGPAEDACLTFCIELDVAWSELTDRDKAGLRALPPQGALVTRSLLGGLNVAVEYHGLAWLTVALRASHVASDIEAVWPLAGMRLSSADHWRAESDRIAGEDRNPLAARPRNSKGERTETADLVTVIDVGNDDGPVSVEEIAAIGPTGPQIVHTAAGLTRIVTDHANEPRLSAVAAAAAKYADLLGTYGALTEIRVLRRDDWIEERVFGSGSDSC